MLYVGGWDAAEDIGGLQAAGVSQIQIVTFYKKLTEFELTNIYKDGKVNINLWDNLRSYLRKQKGSWGQSDSNHYI